MNAREWLEKVGGVPRAVAKGGGGMIGDAMRRVAHEGHFSGRTPIPRVAVAARYKGEVLKANMTQGMDDLVAGKRLPDVPSGQVRANVDRVFGNRSAAPGLEKLNSDLRVTAFLEGFHEEMEKVALGDTPGGREMLRRAAEHSKSIAERLTTAGGRANELAAARYSRMAGNAKEMAGVRELDLPAGYAALAKPGQKSVGNFVPNLTAENRVPEASARMAKMRSEVVRGLRPASE